MKRACPLYPPAFGVEIEYMIVDRETLDVRPLADRLLREPAGRVRNTVRRGSLYASNELVRHVFELKPDAPAVRWRGLSARFQAGVRAANRQLAGENAMLLPSGMHPWMHPSSETALWIHGNRALYAAMDRIFRCRRHGWANLQSTHLNLPFHDEASFLRLHAALRWLVPIVPSLCASSPFCEGRHTGRLDQRLEAYRTNARRIPVLTARTVPEAVPSEGAYRRHILGRIARRLEPLDPDGLLDPLWMNARGIIARFDRGTIELRVVDTQEVPAADIAVCRLMAAAAAWLMERSEEYPAPRISTRRLAAILRRTLREAEQAVITDREYLAGLAWEGPAATGGELWRHLLRRAAPGLARQAALRVIFSEGTLARRLLRRLGPHPSRARLRAVYRELAAGLEAGRPFHGV